MHSLRLGSMLNRRALHSATQLSRLVSHPAAVTQVAQVLAVCASGECGASPTPSARTSSVYRAMEAMVIAARD